MKTARLVLALALLAAACDKLPPLPGKKAATPPPPAGSAAVNEGKQLLAAGQPDAALAKLATDAGADSLALQGDAWAKKAEAAPEPEAGQLLKAEQKTALDLYEKALAAQPGHTGASLGIANLLGPVSVKKHGPLPGGKKRPVAKPKPGPTPSEPEPDVTPERVIAAYRAAVQGDPVRTDALRALIRFAREMQRLDDADNGFRELLNRDKESAGPHVEYGDFLAAERKDRDRAIEQYNLALVWKDEPATKDRICDIYVATAQEHLAKREYALAEARFRDAQKWVTGPQTSQAQAIKDGLEKLRAFRR